MRLANAVTACVATAAWLVGPGLPGPSATSEDICPTPPAEAPVIREVGWVQDLYDAPEQIWPFSTGAGVTVAVLDSGVDGAHQQLPGRVLPGYDLVRDRPGGDVDCASHGTAVASVIAAQRTSGIGFYGLAPDATILPERVAAQAHLAPSTDSLDPTTLAAAIDRAVDGGADVMVISEVVYRDDPVLARATARALQHGVVVVAAAGNGHSIQRDGNGPTTPALTPYPTAYDGVIGVGAVDQTGLRTATSQVGGYVDLVAPGGGVTAAAIGGHDVYDDTGVAAAHVAAAAALLLAQRPSVLGMVDGAELPAAVGRCLTATASPATGGSGDPGYGHGLVDPYRALTEQTTAAAPEAAAPWGSPPRDPVAEQIAHDRHEAAAAAMRLGIGTGLLVLAVLGFAAVLPRGRRRRWRTSRRPPARSDHDEDGELFLPGDALFEPGQQTPAR